MSKVTNRTFKAVTFGPKGKQKKTRPIGIGIPRFTPGETGDVCCVHDLFVDSQLFVELTTDGQDVHGQEIMEFGDKVEPLECIATCSGIRVTGSGFALTLSLPLDVDPAHLDRFGYATGELKVKRLGDRPKDEKPKQDEEEDDDDE